MHRLIDSRRGCLAPQNIDTDTQWAYWDGVRKYEAKMRDYLQGQASWPHCRVCVCVGELTLEPVVCLGPPCYSGRAGWQPGCGGGTQEEFGSLSGIAARAHCEMVSRSTRTKRGCSRVACIDACMQIGNPEGKEKPNKKHYDPRVWWVVMTAPGHSCCHPRHLSLSGSANLPEDSAAAVTAIVTTAAERAM
jgi:hypothetical protein